MYICSERVQYKLIVRLIIHSYWFNVIYRGITRDRVINSNDLSYPRSSIEEYRISYRQETRITLEKSFPDIVSTSSCRPITICQISQVASY